MLPEPCAEVALPIDGHHTQESWPLPLPGQSEKLGKQTNLASTQAHIQGSELSHPNHELLEKVKGLVLQIQSCRISTIQGNNRISEKKSGEDPGLTA